MIRSRELWLAVGALWWACSFGGATLGCADPVHEARLAPLGPEVDGVPAGPLHRPGQPCLLCHGPGGEVEPYVFAGTIFVDDKSEKPAPGVDVWLVDAQRRTHRARTNCAGNFVVRPAEYAPTWPVWVTLRLGDHAIDMESPIYREGSCAACHSSPAGRSSAGHVFLLDDPELEIELPTCAPRGIDPP